LVAREACRSCQIRSRVLLAILSKFESCSSFSSSKTESTRANSMPELPVLGKSTTNRNGIRNCETIFGFFDLEAVLNHLSRCVSKGKRHDSVGSNSVRNNHSAALMLVTGRSRLLQLLKSVKQRVHGVLNVEEDGGFGLLFVLMERQMRWHGTPAGHSAALGGPVQTLHLRTCVRW
jgi:hypothetical protein